jgi:hypothetical protein
MALIVPSMASVRRLLRSPGTCRCHSDEERLFLRFVSGRAKHQRSDGMLAPVFMGVPWFVFAVRDWTHVGEVAILLLQCKSLLESPIYELHGVCECQPYSKEALDSVV